MNGGTCKVTTVGKMLDRGSMGPGSDWTCKKLTIESSGKQSLGAHL